MGNAQSYIVATLSVCSVYLVYVHVYCAHKLLKTTELHSDKLPSDAYVYMKYLSRRVTRRAGCLYGTEKQEAGYTVVSCRWVRPNVLRMHLNCKIAGSRSSWVCVCVSKGGGCSVAEVLQCCRLWLGLSRQWIQRHPAVLPGVSLRQTSPYVVNSWKLQAQPSR